MTLVNLILTLSLLRLIYLIFEKKYHQEESVLEEFNKNSSAQPKPEPETESEAEPQNQNQDQEFATFSFKLGPFEYEKIIPRSEVTVKEPVEINVTNVPDGVGLDGSQQEDSKFAWFLVGLNVAIGCAGLALSSLN